MTLPPSKIGDKGQRFVIQATNWPHEGLQHGWQNIAYSDKPAEFAEVQRAICHPSIQHLRILDRSTDAAPAALIAGVGGITTKAMNGDNLAIVLCGWLDNPDNSGENGWSDEAVLGTEEVLFAIHEHYCRRIRELEAQIIALGATPT